MLFYIKSSKRKHKRNKILNLLIVLTMLTAPFMACISMFIYVGQESSLANCIKVFVNLGFIMKIDYMFAASLPLEIKRLVDELNNQGGLTIPYEKTTLKLSCQRLWKAINFRVFKKHSDESTVAWIKKNNARSIVMMKNECLNIFMCILSTLIQNF